MLWRNRKYKTGTRWGFWLWTDVESEFIRRLHVIKTPWFAICLHWILKPDPEPWLHDHPVSFLSLILRGGYTEDRQTGQQPFFPGDADSCVRGLRKHRWFNWIRASEDDRHSITDCAPNTLTLCFMGPKTREWGYHTPEGWIHWRTYNKTKYGP